jgi:hypothetical protein
MGKVYVVIGKLGYSENRGQSYLERKKSEKFLFTTLF